MALVPHAQITQQDGRNIEVNPKPDNTPVFADLHDHKPALKHGLDQSIAGSIDLGATQSAYKLRLGRY